MESIDPCNKNTSDFSIKQTLGMVKCLIFTYAMPRYTLSQIEYLIYVEIFYCFCLNHRFPFKDIYIINNYLHISSKSSSSNKSSIWRYWSHIVFQLICVNISQHLPAIAMPKFNISTCKWLIKGQNYRRKKKVKNRNASTIFQKEYFSMQGHPRPNLIKYIKLAKAWYFTT